MKHDLGIRIKPIGLSARPGGVKGLGLGSEDELITYSLSRADDAGTRLTRDFVPAPVHIETVELVSLDRLGRLFAGLGISNDLSVVVNPGLFQAGLD